MPHLLGSSLAPPGGFRPPVPFQPSPFGPQGPFPGGPFDPPRPRGGNFPGLPFGPEDVERGADLACRLFGFRCPKVPGGPAPGGGIPLDPPLCIPPFKLDPISKRCVLDLDPGPGTGLPGGPDGGGVGLVQPTTVCVETMVCPKFADNKKGVLWMNALTGLVVCLPRGTNGTGFGLIRKNTPRRKAFVTAAEISALRRQATTKKKAKKFAALTGQVCVARGSRNHRAR